MILCIDFVPEALDLGEPYCSLCVTGPNVAPLKRLLWALREVHVSEAQVCGPAWGNRVKVPREYPVLAMRYMHTPGIASICTATIWPRLHPALLDEPNTVHARVLIPSHGPVTKVTLDQNGKRVYDGHPRRCPGKSLVAGE